MKEREGQNQNRLKWTEIGQEMKVANFDRNE